MIIEPESIRDLEPRLRDTVPPLEQRMHQPVGAEVRIIVVVDGAAHEHPWVTITEITDAGYVGSTCQNYGMTATTIIPKDTEIVFTADNIIEI